MRTRGIEPRHQAAQLPPRGVGAGGAIGAAQRGQDVSLPALRHHRLQVPPLVDLTALDHGDVPEDILQGGAQALAPSITQSRRPSTASPRASTSWRSWVHTAAFSVEPTLTPKGSFRPSRVTPGGR